MTGSTATAILFRGWATPATGCSGRGKAGPRLDGPGARHQPAWFEPLFAALDRRGVDWSRIHAGDHVFDVGPRAPSAPLIFNRIGMSAFLRETEHPIFYARALFDHWEGQGARIINGPALEVDTSKGRQISLIRRLGYGAPETRMVHRAADLPKAAEGLRFPVLVKPDIGGSGAGIQRFDTAGALAEQARITTIPGLDAGAPPPGFADFDQWLSGAQLERELKIQEYSVSNRGLRPQLVGMPEQIAARVEAYEDAGLDLLLLQMSPQYEEMERFSAQVIKPGPH